MFVLQFLDYEPWMWIIDCEQICSLLLGRCIDNRMLENSKIRDIVDWKSWLKLDLFYEGLVKLVTSSNANEAKTMSKCFDLHIPVL